MSDILKAADATGFYRAAVAPIEFDQVQADAQGKSGTKKFSLVAYTGQAMHPSNWYSSAPIVLDIAAGSIPRQSVPADYEHGPLIGHTTSIETSAQRVYMAGVLSAFSDTEQSTSAEATREVTRLAANGFPWQASMEFSVQRVEFIEAGAKANVNGKSISGPAYVARAWTLRRISIVANGADGDTTASIAASQNQGANMDPKFVEWLQAKSIDTATLTDGSVKTILLASWDAEMKAAAAKKNGPPPEDEMIARHNRIQAEATMRIDDIRGVCAKYSNPTIVIQQGGVDATVSLEAHAIRENWTAKDTELYALRAERLKAKDVGRPASGTPTGIPTKDANEVLAAAICRVRGMKNLEKHFRPEILEAASSNKRLKNIGLQQLILTAAVDAGYQVSAGERIHDGNMREILTFAFKATGFSGISLSGILGSVANKELLSGYMEEDNAWRDIAKIRSVSNFHAVTTYRMLDDMEYEELGPAGEIKHGSVSQESYTRQAKTFAKMFALTRQDTINDDLGAFDDLRDRIGRGAAKKLAKVFWEAFVNNSSFFTTARTNYISGATSNLGSDGVGLGLGVTAFRKMTSPSADGSKRVGQGKRPTILLVPPELEQIAEALFRNQNLDAVATSSANIFANKYRPVVAWQLSDPAYTGYSTTAWYLLSEPAQEAAVVVSFLNGQEMPTVESADADFDVLGIQFRGFHDFGCNQADYLCGVKSKGAA